MISPLQNLQALQTILTVEQQLLANILQNLAPAEGQQQQTAGQTGNAANVPSPGLRPPSPPTPEGGHFVGGEGKKETGLLDSADSSAQTIKETGEAFSTKQNDQALSLKEQIVSLTQTLVQQGHLPSSTLTQPPAIMIPQMLACLGKIHREEKKKEKKKKKGGKKEEENESPDESPIDSLIKQVFEF
ncbi:MAG: hypothetical protein HY541_02120 [Deltaproteobacteria bacterium]|nr:hypothetical protein [Deltaproteobacteria bacterium]